MNNKPLALQDGSPNTSLALRSNSKAASPTSRNGNGCTVRKVQSSRARARIKRWHAAFLRSLAKTPSVTIAARSAGVSTRACYKARDNDPEFAEAWSDAVNKSIDTLEHEVYQRALREDSQLAMFVLKAFRPERYRETSRVDVGLLGGIVLIPAKTEGAE